MAGWSGVLFDSVDITLLTGVMITAIDHHKRPVRQSTWQKLSRAAGKKLVNSEYAERLITIEGVLTGTSRGDYETNRDNFLKYLDVQEGVLRVPQSGGNREYVCTVDDVDYREKPVGGFAPFMIKFIASNPPYGLDTSATTDLSASSNTAASATKTIAAIGGSANALPLITVSISALTGGTSKLVKITNPATGKYIQVTRTWTAADVLVIDVENKTVKVNGTAVDYIGSFPEFRPSDTQLQYDDGLTTRTCAISMTHKKRWL